MTHPRSHRLAFAVVTATAIVSFAAVPACDCAGPLSTTTAAPDCDAGDAAFVRQATLAIVGRRPLSEAEVQAAVQAIEAVDDIEGADHGAASPGRKAWALSLMSTSEYGDRFEQHVMDALFVPRTGVQSLAGCYDARDRDDDDTALAEYVRDSGALDGDDKDGPFTYRDLLRSALALDDLSPVYRAHLFAMVTTPNACGNVDPVAQELAVRDEVGAVFQAAYIDRDPVCLQCHNSEASVTDREDPAEDRFWPLPGTLEAAVFGDSFSVDPKVADAPFRTTDFLGNGSGGPAFADFDYTLGWCYEPNQGDVQSAGCTGPSGDVACPDGYFPFCWGAGEPSCDESGLTVCSNDPFCLDQSTFDLVDSTLSCSVDDGDATCDADPALVAVCADSFVNGQLAQCSAGALAPCPNPAVDGGGGGGGGGGAPGDSAFTPWGADESCGVFSPQVPDDPAGVDGHLASVRGRRATVVNLEAALHRGVDALTARGLVVRDDGSIDGPDEALAYLVAAHVVDGVWREIIGSPLTIATHFPRNEASRDELRRLTADFVRSHSSLRGLVLDIVTSPYFNLKAPEEQCGEEAYALPAVFDPWVRTEPDPAMRGNSVADGVHVLSGRTLLRAAYAALGWPHPDDESFPEGDGDLDATCFDFPDCAALSQECDDNDHCCNELVAFGCPGSASGGDLAEIDLQRGLGIFHGFSEKGFRGVDFQVRLTWESRFGRCEKPEGVARDFIDDLVDEAKERHASVGDAVSALKERFIDEPALDDDERAALAQLDGDLGLGAAAVDLEGDLRAVCGVLLSTPQFQLAGIAPKGGAASPLSPTGADACAALAAQGLAGYDVSCDAHGHVAVKRR